MSELHVPDTGPFAIVQAALFIVIVGGGILAALRGERKQKDGPAPATGGVSLFLDGPIKVIIDHLQGIYRRAGETNEILSDGLRDIRSSQEQILLEFVRSGSSAASRKTMRARRSRKK